MNEATYTRPTAKRRRINESDASIVQYHNDDRVASQVGIQNVTASVYNHTIQYLHNQDNDTDSALDAHRLSNKRRLFHESLSFDQLEARHATIKPAHAETCRWFLSSPDYKNWLDDEMLQIHHGLLWVKGRPATGKSTLMKFAFTSTQKQQKGSIVLAFFFNARGDELEKSTLGMYRSLIFQLLQQQPELRSVFDDFPAARSGDTPIWDNNTLVNLFNRVVERLDDRAVILFIDALDECAEEQVRVMLSDLEQLGRVANAISARFRICLSSRHYPHITILHGLSLILEDQQDHASDIAQYVKTELRIGSGKAATQIKSDLLDRAGGIFLWVVLVIRILNTEHDRGVGSLAKKLKTIPDKLETLFKDMLTREGRPGQELSVCLQWVLFAIRPLKSKELYAAIRAMAEPDASLTWDREEDDEEKVERYILNCSKGLVEQTKGKSPTVQFIHESVRDFFLTGHGLQNLQLGSIESFRATSHEAMKECCRRYYVAAGIPELIDLEDFLLAKTDAANKLRGRVQDSFPFLDYAVANVLDHSNVAHNLGQDQTGFVRDFDLEYWVLLHNFVQRHKVNRYPEDVSLLYVLADKTLDSLISAQHTERPWSSIICGRHQCPLAVALVRRHHGTLRALLQWRCVSTTAESAKQPDDADLHKAAAMMLADGYAGTLPQLVKAAILRKDQLIMNCLQLLSREEFDQCEISLAEAAEAGNDELIERLLKLDNDHDQGDTTDEDPNNSKRVLGHALFVAAKGGHVKVMKGLMHAAVQSGHGHLEVDHAIAFAARNGHLEAVQVLMRAPFNLRKHDFFTSGTLVEVTANGHEAIARLLIDGGIDVNETGFHRGTALSVAARNGSENLVRMLLDGGAEVDLSSMGGIPLIAAVMSGSEVCLQMLLAAGANINITDRYRETALTTAAAGGHERMVRSLLGSGADHSVEAGYHGSALAAAAAKGHLGVVQILLQGGADPNLQAGWHGNALTSAVINGHKDVVEALLKAGAHVNASGSYGKALTVAIEREHQNIARLLIDAGAVQ